MKQPAKAEVEEEVQADILSPLPSLGEASTSRSGALISSLREGLLACPLEAVTVVLPKDFMPESGPATPEMLAEAFIHAQFQVRFPNMTLLSHTYPFFFFFCLTFSFSVLQCIIRSVALWRNFQRVAGTPPSLEAKAAEMQSRIQELEFDVSRTKDLESKVEVLKSDHRGSGPRSRDCSEADKRDASPVN